MERDLGFLEEGEGEGEKMAFGARSISALKWSSCISLARVAFSVIF